MSRYFLNSYRGRCDSESDDDDRGDDGRGSHDLNPYKGRCDSESDEDDRGDDGRGGYVLNPYKGRCDSESDEDDRGDDGRGGYVLNPYKGRCDSESDEDDRGDDGRGGYVFNPYEGRCDSESDEDDRGDDGRGGYVFNPYKGRCDSESDEDDRGDDGRGGYVLNPYKGRCDSESDEDGRGSTSKSSPSKTVLVLNPFQVTSDSDDYEGRSGSGNIRGYSYVSDANPAPKRSGLRTTAKYFETRMRNVNLPSGDRKLITSILNEYGCRCPYVGANVNYITLQPHGFESGREYRIVKDELHTSLKYHRYRSYSIKKIVKVQNCCLWAEFRRREREIASQVGYVNERMLFHGSGAAETIVKKGFDISKAKAGWFGRGAYFADNSALSNLYASRRPTQRRTMLFCRVAMGKMHVVPRIDRTLLRPPPGNHSVYGDVRIPEFIVYDGYQAYPEYLVYYDLVF